jgi:hypothetical protein
MLYKRTLQLRALWKIVTLCSFFALLSVGVSRTAFAAATVSLSPASGSYSVGSTFSVQIMADGAGAPMNAVESVLSFDSSLLSVTSATKEGSVFSLWTTEPAFDNTKGTISFGGGNPTPFTKKSTLAKITFKVLKEGTAKVEFASASVLAADGKGTDILGDKLSGSYTLSGKATPPPPPKTEPEPEPEPVSDGLVPDAPVIKSTTHPDENGWYNKKDGEFSWENLPDVTSARLALSAKADAKPTVLYTPAIDTKKVTDLEDGIWYLHAQLKNSSGWGKVSTRKIQIDLVPPTPFSVAVGGEATSSTPTLLIGSTTDARSGLDHYEIVIGTESPVPVKLSEVVNGAYKILPHAKGSYSVLVRVFDRAGNFTEANASMNIEADLTAKKMTEEEKPSLWQRYGMISIIVILLLIIVFLIIMNFYQKNKLMREMRRGAKEAEEIRTKMEKILSALKDEVEEQINALDKKPRLSDAEKRAISKIKEAIDISEELISKEIEDVEKILE